MHVGAATDVVMQDAPAKFVQMIAVLSIGSNLPNLLIR
jgi:hypothetical protein